MFEFCPHCGQTIGQKEIAGRMLICQSCGQKIGLVATMQKASIDENEELIKRGAAARCPHCSQVVQTKTGGQVPAMVPHMRAASRKMCPGSGKPVSAPASVSAIQRPATSKDLSAYIKREVIRVATCAKTGELKVEELILEYLDPADRVRLQIDAMRDLLGPAFAMMAYPAPLNKPHLAIWANDGLRVIAQKHPDGGYQPMAEADLQAVLADLLQHKSQFWP